MSPRIQNDVADTIVFVPAELDEYGLSASEFRVYCHLARRAGQGGAWPSVASMAEVCRLKEDTVRSVLKTLHANGMLTRVERPGATTIYRLTTPKMWRQPLPNGGSTLDRYPSPETGGEDSQMGGGDPSQMGGDEGTPLKGIQRRNTPIPPEPVSREDREVEEVYAAYPRKVAKGQALRAIRTALKRAGFEVLLAATQAYADAVARWAPEERQFVPFPATWFNGHRWEDDRSTWVRAGNRAPVEKPVPAWLVQKRQRLLEDWQEVERERRRAIAHGLTPQRNAATFADIERRMRAAQAALEAEGGAIPSKTPA